jgi:hypothetical protein
MKSGAVRYGLHLPTYICMCFNIIFASVPGNTNLTFVALQTQFLYLTIHIVSALQLLFGNIIAYPEKHTKAINKLCGLKRDFSGALEKLRKETNSFVMSVCPSVWKNSAPSVLIFVKFDIWTCFENLSRKLKFHNNEGYIT